MIISPVHFPQYKIKPRDSRGDSFSEPGFYFERGSWALAYGIMAIAKKRAKNRVRVWFPDYFCKEPLGILKNFPIEIVYYPVMKNLMPDWAVLEDQDKSWYAQGVSLRPDAMVLVHYFGFVNDIEVARKFCGARGIELIEDCAHVMASFGAMGTSGSISIWSPWKFFPIPLLGILKTGNNFSEAARIFLPRHDILSGIRWHVKREIQRLLSAAGLNWYVKGQNASEDKSKGSSFANPGLFSLKLFLMYSSIGEYISTARIKNYKQLEDFFKEKYPDRLLFDMLPQGTVPYVFPCLFKEPVKQYVDALTRRGIPAARWPVLPDVVRANPERFSMAHFYADHLMLLPVHQNVSTIQIEYMKRQIQDIIR